MEDKIENKNWLPKEKKTRYFLRMTHWLERIRGETVWRLTQDQKIACSNGDESKAYPLWKLIIFLAD